MNLDAVAAICKTDTLILQFGERLVQKHRDEVHHNQYISTKMRELGRLLVSLRKSDVSRNLSDFLSPEKFEQIISSVKDVCGYQGDILKYKTPSLALKLRHSLKKCASINLAKAMVQGNADAEAKLKAFLELYDLQWGDVLSRGALTTLRETRLNEPEIKPLAKDVQIVQNHLDEQTVKTKKILEEEGTPEAYKAFAEVLLVRLLLFARRRQGEVNRVTVEDLRKGIESSEATNADCDVPLTAFEQHIAKDMTRILIRGKKGRGVPILVTKDLKNNLTLLISKRQEAQIPNHCPHLFANPLSADHRPLRGSDCLHKLVSHCEVDRAQAMTSTALRKQIATLSQFLNLGIHEFTNLLASWATI